MRFFPPIFLLAVAVWLPVAIAAQEPRRVPLELSADRLDHDENRRLIRLVGKVRVRWKENRFWAPYGEVRTDTWNARFQRGVKLVRPDSTVVGNEMKVFFREGRVAVQGSVRFVARRLPGEEAGSSAEPLVVLSDEMQYSWEEETGEATGRVEIRRGSRRAFSDAALYRGREGEVGLVGDVRFENGQGDWVSCDRARLDLATDTIMAEGGVVARFHLKQHPPPRPAAPAEEPLPPPRVVEPELPMETSEPVEPLPLPGL